MEHPIVRLLHVEDNPTDALLVQELLDETPGMRVEITQAERLSEGLRYLSEQSFHLIFLDLSLPDSFGLATFERIYNAAPRTPILLFTGLADDELATTAVRQGAKDYLVKAQMDGATLVRAMRYALARAEAEESASRLLLEQSARLAAEQANQAKAQFLATMSHEIRTPINAIVGFVDLMQAGVTGDLSPLQEQYMERIKVSSAHLLSLVNDILDFAKIESGMLSMRVVSGCPREIVQAALSMVEPLARIKGLPCHVELPEEGLPSFKADPDRVRQILANLLSNAIKFTSAGGITLRGYISHAEGAQEGTLSIEVHDTGIGLSPSDQSRVFDPFYQVDGNYTRTKGGAGLGLSISRMLARLMGGEITVSSEAGRGSCFALHLPCAIGSMTQEVAMPGFGRE